MTQDQFCDGVRLIGGKKSAAQLLAINERAIERIMSGRETLGEGLANRLYMAVASHYRQSGAWLEAIDAA
jgi:plasmid maintenance system antidote protein VapI